MRDIWKNRNLIKVVAVGFAIFVFFYNLGGRFLEDWDEGFYVVMSQTAIKNNNYLFLEYQNDIHWSKTPFPLYPMMASFKLLGVSEFSARLSSALFSLGLLLLIYLMAKRYYGEWTAVLAVLITVTCAQFIFDHGLKTANIDALTLFLFTASISSWLLIKTPAYRIMMTFVSLSFAFLCKGPIIVIPVTVICLSFMFENPVKRGALKPLLAGLSVAVAIILPWYLYAYSVYGHVFLEKHILYNFVQRYTEGIEGHVHENLYFIKYLLSTEHFIWTGAAMVSVFYFFGIVLRGKRMIDFVLLSWVLVTFLIVNFSQTKLPYYMFPLYPPLAIITAKTLTDFAENPGFLNRSAVWVGMAAMLISDNLSIFGFHPYIYHKLFNDIFDINKTKIAALTGILIIILLAFLLKKYPLQSRKKVRILLLCGMCVIPILKTSELTIKKDLNAPISSLFEKLDFSRPIYTLAGSGRVFPPGAYYYLTTRGEVTPYSDLRPSLKGKRVVMTTIAVDELRVKATEKATDGTFEVAYKGDVFKLSPMVNSKGFSLVNIE